MSLSDSSVGPFAFSRGSAVRLSGVPHRRWTMSYDGRELGWHHVPEGAGRSELLAAFQPEIHGFRMRAQEDSGVAPVLLYDATTEEVIARLPVLGGVVEGMRGVIPDERHRYWLRTSSKPTLSMPVSLDEFAEIAVTLRAPRRAWIAGLLPDGVLTHDAEEWRAPTAWEIRHVVGEGSLTEISGAKAAALVGVTPQNFRKYTAADGAKTRQGMSFALWHLLLHRLEIQRLP